MPDPGFEQIKFGGVRIVQNPYLPKDSAYWYGDRRPDETREEWLLRCSVITNIGPPESKEISNA